MPYTYYQSVDIFHNGEYQETRASVCPVHPSSGPKDGPYDVSDKTLRQADGSVICWHGDYVLQSYKDGSSCFWVNPKHVLRLALEGFVYNVGGPEPSTGMYVKLYKDGTMEVRTQGKYYTWSFKLPAEPTSGIEIASCWHRCTDTCWYNKYICFISNNPKERCPCSYSHRATDEYLPSSDELIEDSIQHSQELEQATIDEQITFLQKESEAYEQSELGYLARQATDEHRTAEDLQQEYQEANCQGCGCVLPIEEVNCYRVGYWCSRMCAYDL